MDFLSIAAIAAPYLSKKAGEKIGGEVGDLAQAVANKVKGDSYAEQTLARAREKPESKERENALKGVLAEKMEVDPVFAEELSKLVDRARKEKAGAVFDQRGQIVQGNQTNIGEANAPVFSGTFSEPVAFVGEAADLRSSMGSNYRPGIVNQHFWTRSSDFHINDIDDIDKKILVAMAPGGTYMQIVDDLSKMLLMNKKELQERLEILAGTTPYVKEEIGRTMDSIGPEIVSLTPHGLKLVRNIGSMQNRSH